MSDRNKKEGALAAWLMRNWQRRGGFALLMWPLSLLLATLTRLRAATYRNGICKSTRLPVPVIVVGNIFIGGTGKTPFTIWLAIQLRKAGYHPGLVSRGYGADPRTVRPVLGNSSASEVGDEPLLLAQHSHCPVWVGRTRAEAALALLDHHPEVNLIIADDGLQHYPLARDIEIMLFDDRAYGNGWVLPAGPLREPATRRSDFFVVNGRHDALPHAYRMQLRPGAAWQLCNPQKSKPLSDFSLADRIIAAAGIGNPQRFFDGLHQAQLHFDELPLPDHYTFDAQTFATLPHEVVLITEKDAVKCLQISGICNDDRIWVVPVSAEIEGDLVQQILEKLRKNTKENPYGHASA